MSRENVFSVKGFILTVWNVTTGFRGEVHGGRSVNNSEEEEEADVHTVPLQSIPQEL